MIVVVPLRAIFSLWRVFSGIQNAGAVVAVLQDQMYVPAGFRGELAGGGADIMQQRQPARLDDGIDGIEPQSVEAIVAQPRERVLDREGADFFHAIIDRAAP